MLDLVMVPSCLLCVRGSCSRLLTENPSGGPWPWGPARRSISSPWGPWGCLDPSVQNPLQLIRFRKHCTTDGLVNRSPQAPQHSNPRIRIVSVYSNRSLRVLFCVGSFGKEGGTKWPPSSISSRTVVPL